MSATTELILSLRRLGLSQSEIARRTRIPQPRVSRWEGGEAPASADDALKLQALLAEVAAANPAASAPAPSHAATATEQG